MQFIEPVMENRHCIGIHAVTKCRWIWRVSVTETSEMSAWSDVLDGREC
jgi:hypothetical protein